MWKPGYYQWLLDFIDKPENTKIFFWIVEEQLEKSFNVPANIQGNSNLN